MVDDARTSLGVSLCLVVSTSCRKARTPPASGIATTERDSAGIRIVWSSRPSLDPAHAWRVDSVLTATHPEFLPSINSVQCDPEGNYWVRDSPPAFFHGPGQWSVFSHDGKWLTQLTLPEGAGILQIGSDFLLQRSTPIDETEHIRIFRPGK
jgi:hypothetical protein